MEVSERAGTRRLTEKAFSEDTVKKYREKNDMARDLTVGIPDAALERFKRFCKKNFGTEIDVIPSEESIFMKQCLSIIYYATFLFLLTNGFYLVKNYIMNTRIVIDMVPLYMMVVSSLAMLLFLTFYKEYGSPVARFAQLAFYTMIIASVTVFMVSCNYHSIGLSISMCYLFVIMIAPTYRLPDTIAVCVLIFIGWWLPAVLPYAENYNLFKHFLLRFAIVIGFIAVRIVFIRQAATERHAKEMSNAFIKLAYNDIMTGAMNKKAMEAYRTFVTEKIAPERISVILYDIDNFKSYNDHYSHVAGDEALRIVAESVAAVLEEEELYLFRFGGEEFVVILPGVAEEDARAVAEKLLAAVRAAAIPRGDLSDASERSERNIVTASFGVACGTNAEFADLSVIEKADRQLYIGKNGGKDCVVSGDMIYR